MVDAGSEFEIADETIDIIEAPRRRSDPGQTQTVQITLSPKHSRVRRAAPSMPLSRRSRSGAHALQRGFGSRTVGQ